MRFPVSTQAYAARVKAVCGANLVAHWPLDEASGATANDVSGHAYHGAYTGVDLARPGVIGTAPYFDGLNDYVNIYSAGLAGAFNGAEGSLFIWARVANAGVWTDATGRRIVKLQADANNYLLLMRGAGNDSLEFYYGAGGVVEGRATTAAGGVSGWFSLGISWSAAADEVRVYVSRTQIGATQTILGTWAGALASGSVIVGANTAVPVQVWSGWLAHAVLTNRALTPAEMAVLGVLR